MRFFSYFALEDATGAMQIVMTLHLLLLYLAQIQKSSSGVARGPTFIKLLFMLNSTEYKISTAQ